MDPSNASSWRAPMAMVGVGLSAFTSGTIASLSLVAIPAILTNTTDTALLTSWRKTLDGGVRVCPPLAVFASIAHIANAYANRDSPSKSARYSILAAISTMAIVPFTLILLQPTNNRLFKLQETARGSSTGVENVSKELVQKWGRLNLARSLLPAIGAAIGCFVLQE